jgi:hypothetical protein
MSPISYIELARKAFPDQPPYQWSAFQDAPLTHEDRLGISQLSLVPTYGRGEKGRGRIRE